MRKLYFDLQNIAIEGNDEFFDVVKIQQLCHRFSMFFDLDSLCDLVSRKTQTRVLPALVYAHGIINDLNAPTPRRHSRRTLGTSFFRVNQWLHLISLGFYSGKIQVEYT